MQTQVPLLKYVPSFQVIGLQTRTKNQDEFNIKTAKLPILWQRFNASPLACNTQRFGVYSDYETDAQGFYTVTAGVKSEHSEDANRASVVQAGTYLVFQGKGTMPSVVIDTWKSVWDYFSAENPYQRSYKTDFEVYHHEGEVEIFIGVS